MFNVINVSKAYGPKKLFEEVNVTFSPGRRYGLTGPNGAGKSTFMKILAGDEEADMGTISRPKRLGILRQDHFRYEDTRVLDVVLMGNKPLWEAMHEKNTAAGQVGHHRGGRQPAGRARGRHRRGGRLRRRERRGHPAGGPRHRRVLPRGPHAAADGRPQAARAARAGAVRQARGPAARRAHEQPGHRVHPLAGELPHTSTRAC